MFAGVLQEAAQHLALNISIDACDVRTSLPTQAQLDRADAFLITGSRHSVYDDLPWIAELVTFVEAALKADKKIIGICFGHQLMAHFFGGRVGAADKGWAVGVHNNRVTAQFSWMQHTEQDNVALLSSHKDQVLELPADAQVFLASDFCPVAGFVQGDQVITVQGHPEFSKPYARRLMQYREALLGEQTFQSGIESLGQPLHSQASMIWILQFLLQGHDGLA